MCTHRKLQRDVGHVRIRVVIVMSQIHYWNKPCSARIHLTVHSVGRVGLITSVLFADKFLEKIPQLMKLWEECILPGGKTPRLAELQWLFPSALSTWKECRSEYRYKCEEKR